jgi:hypothetical protein
MLSLSEKQMYEDHECSRSLVQLACWNKTEVFHACHRKLHECQRPWNHWTLSFGQLDNPKVEPRFTAETYDKRSFSHNTLRGILGDRPKS